MKAYILQVSICFILYIGIVWWENGLALAMYQAGQFAFSFIIIGVVWFSITSISIKSIRLFKNKWWLLAIPFMFAFPFIAQQTEYEPSLGMANHISYCVFAGVLFGLVSIFDLSSIKAWEQNISNKVRRLFRGK